MYVCMYVCIDTRSTYKYMYIGDRVSLPPEHHEHFSEKLLLMNPTYIVNDYAQVQGDILQFHGDNVLTLHT